MTPREAARVIGCSTAHVRALARKGKLPAVRIESPANPETGEPGYGYCYEIPRRAVEAYRDSEQAGGYPRGQKRRKRKSHA